MAATYSQLYVQIVFTVKRRKALIPEKHAERIRRYITGIIQMQRHKVYSINNVPDHIHILVSLNPSESISDLVKRIKVASTNLINDNQWVPGGFQWQSGYGAFSYSPSDVKNVAEYIDRQQEHHRAKDFKTEYKQMLEEHEIDYDEQYMLDI
ncbi:MAG: IS200/IS605 family transposase [Bacteroidetes bacterium]|nr:IS200/IS605 family transposase [Bacteroidota bacterium]